MGFGMRLLSLEDEIRINFLKAVRPGEFENWLHDRASAPGEKEARISELFEFSDRILFDPRNKISLREIFPPTPIVGLWEFLFSGRPDQDLISDNPLKVKFKDYESGRVYEMSKMQLVS